MSIVILGGNKCMTSQYSRLLKKHKIRNKIFNTMEADIEKRIGTPDKIILFKDCSSHKLLRVADKVCKKYNIDLIRAQSSSKTELEKILCELDCHNCNLCK
ncbi:MAG: DUF2325 domain-containing protein [Lachnospirales bacterium]